MNTGRYQALEPSIRSSLTAAAGGEKYGITYLNVVLGDDELLRQLNKDYRGFDEPTDVLAFDLGDAPSTSVEGDIYLSLDRAAVQAAERGESISREALRLIIHGFLHLCGWDHDDEDSLKRMVDHGESYILELQETT